MKVEKFTNEIGIEIFIAALQAIGYIIAAVTLPLWIIPFLYNRWNDRKDKS